MRAELLRVGRTKSCGCLRSELGRAMGVKTTLRHGEGSNGKETPEYRAWSNMLSRCNNANHRLFKHYGARGISVCAEWRTYENFIANMGRRPSDAHSLDRINNEGNYEPSNCRWATSTEQNNNRRDPPNPGRPARSIVVLGTTRTVDEWLVAVGLSRSTFYRHVRMGELAEDVILDALLSRT